MDGWSRPDTEASKQVAGDFEAEAESDQDFAQEGQAQGAADVGADAAGELQMNVILVGVVAVKGIQIGDNDSRIWR